MRGSLGQRDAPLGHAPLRCTEPAGSTPLASQSSQPLLPQGLTQNCAQGAGAPCWGQMGARFPWKQRGLMAGGLLAWTPEFGRGAPSFVLWLLALRPVHFA